MRALPLLLVVGVLAAPLALAASQSCYAIPPGALAGHGSCSVSFSSAPGTIVVQVAAWVGSVGEVVIRGDGPGNGGFAATCYLGYAFGQCSQAIYFLVPTPGAWTVTATATNANVGGSDSSVVITVTYP